jgi:N-acetylglutamate synthase-like GNAT family acetyltransferase
MMHSLCEIRPAREQDAVAISALILGLAHVVTGSTSPDAAPAYFKDMGVQPTRDRIAGGQFGYWVAEAQGEMVGVVAMRDMTHLFNLFIDARWQGCGLGRRLWETAKAHAIAWGGPAVFTVNASPNAATIYRRWGFADTAPLMERGGIAFIPMQYVSGADSPPKHQAMQR